MVSLRVGVPKPGPAKLSSRSGLDEWLEEAKQCHYLPEPVMKELCEMVKEVLMEGTYILLIREAQE
jgi:serine/threonine-protein phosphatase PP1-1